MALCCFCSRQAVLTVFRQFFRQFLQQYSLAFGFGTQFVQSSSQQHPRELRTAGPFCLLWRMPITSPGGRADHFKNTPPLQVRVAARAPPFPASLHGGVQSISFNGTAAAGTGAAAGGGGGAARGRDGSGDGEAAGRASGGLLGGQAEPCCFTVSDQVRVRLRVRDEPSSGCTSRSIGCTCTDFACLRRFCLPRVLPACYALRL